MDQPINFFSEDISFEITNPDPLKVWICDIIDLHGHSVAEINYIFCSDVYLHQMNVEHLNHDSFTDIITFPLSEPGQMILSDIFISVDRVRENASERDIAFDDELNRVMIHGALHLCGFDDKTAELKDRMRELENEALARR